MNKEELESNYKIIELKERINKALHYIQLLQMDGEVTIKDLTKLVNILYFKR